MKAIVMHETYDIEDKECDMIFRVWLGTLGAPLAEASSYEEAIKQAIAEVEAQDGFGDGPHQFRDEDELINALSIEEVHESEA